MKISVESFGNFAKLFILENNNGVQLSVSDFGARIVSLKVPVGEDELRELVLGFDSAEDYLKYDTYIGATIGRVAGRIANGQFKIDNQVKQAAIQNETGHCLHGGPESFEVKYWQANQKISENQVAVTFTYLSLTGENGFEGNVEIAVTYTLDNENQWTVEYFAKSDADTLFNPTNHVYFNLLGDSEKCIDEHLLTISAEEFAVIDENILTTGEKRSVNMTPFDFRRAKPIRKIFETEYSQICLVDGLDHPFFFSDNQFDQVKVKLVSPDDIVAIEMRTTEPAVVIFTANFGAKKIKMRNRNLINHGGITLETQVAPGAEKYHDFGNIQLNTNEKYRSKTVYQLKFLKK